jgi:uncharacterized protein (DUF488 family)
MNRIVFTIGHSTHSIEKFLNLLASHQVNAVADVRSSPFSRINPQFNHEKLQQTLHDVGIHYVFLGKELGARSDDPACYVNDKVQYQRLARTDLFRSGLERVVEGANSYRVALMCAEKDPLQCHRAILVARELINRELEVMHVLADGSLETHADSIVRLIAKFDIPADDMFLSRDEIEDMAYAKQAEKIAYDRRAHHSKPRKRESDVVQSGTDR